MTLGVAKLASFIKLRIGYAGAVVGVGCMLVFVALFSRHVLTDTTIHVQAVVRIAHGEAAMPANFMVYTLIWLLTGFSDNFMWLMGASVLVLSVFGVLRWAATAWLLRLLGLSDGASNWLAIALMFVNSLPTFELFTRGCYVCYSPAPNNWMNRTVWLSWPIAVMLFGQSYAQLQCPEVRWWRSLALWLLLLLATKPSYGFVFVSVYPVLLVIRHGFSAAVRSHLLVLLVMLGGIALEYALLYLSPNSLYVQAYNHGEQSGMTIQPFRLWAMYSDNIAVSILSALLFPMLVTTFWWRSIRKKLLFQYVWLGCLSGMLMSVLFVEKGDFYYAWNMRWQVYICSYLCFVVSAAFVWQKWQGWQRSTILTRVASICFLLHLFSGCVYLLHYYQTKHY